MSRMRYLPRRTVALYTLYACTDEMCDENRTTVAS
jgi:hypothetical protein